MSKIHWLRVFLNERLIAAAEEIFGAVEKTIAEEVSRSKEENGRLQSLLDITLLKLHRADMLQQISQEDVPPDQQDCVKEWIPSLRQNDPGPKQIKEEQEELRTTPWDGQLQDDTSDKLFTPTFIEPDSEISVLQSRLYEVQNNDDDDDEEDERIYLPSTSTAHIKTETCGEEYRVPETTSDSQHIFTGNPYCSAAQSKNIEGMGIGEITPAE
ncbi:hypothetical protein DPEC_G00164830 [Dallia pectoralis]|uniref:Uncharacterized protein n=1 Tax=Dallia pectoralis TaxID=75939 RepID=A0ACC2GH55_DALPE|nr:hypothetical protein DPEC_G00164830 [Dallia pectoralis]